MIVSPHNQVFWYVDVTEAKLLTHDSVADVVVVGGGMAGLTTAQLFRDKGLSVILVEKNYCGAGASGKSSGFITPDSELSLFELIRLFGLEKGKKIWQMIGSGVDIIRDNITQYDLDCDYSVQDTLIIANTQRAYKNDIQKEYDTRCDVGYTSTLYGHDTIHSVIGSHGYVGGISYGGTFGIHAYKYCQAMKRMLQKKGVRVYEETPAIEIKDKKVVTPHATIRAEHIVVCTDKFEPAQFFLRDSLYHVQTFLMLSRPLTDNEVKKIFPQQPFMVWDTDMIYHYYRLTGDNRLMLGGSDLLYTYAKNEIYNNNRVARKLTDYFSLKFPSLSVEFEYIWPGLIGISKDIFPLAGFDKDHSSVYYIAGSCGLPFAAALGNYCVDRIINNNTEFDEYLSPYRSFTCGPLTQALLGTRLTFALSHFLSVGSL